MAFAWCSNFALKMSTNVFAVVLDGLKKGSLDLPHIPRGRHKTEMKTDGRKGCQIFFYVRLSQSYFPGKGLTSDTRIYPTRTSNEYAWETFAWLHAGRGNIVRESTSPSGDARLRKLNSQSWLVGRRFFIVSISVKNCFLHDRSYTDVLAEGLGTDGDFYCILFQLRHKNCVKSLVLKLCFT